MKKELRLFFAEVGRDMKQPKHWAIDFERLSRQLKEHHVNLSGKSLKKVWEVLSGQRKLSPEALDRLALFAGFQSWRDLQETLRGDTDASINYEDK
jgi:hypothetical protein